MEHQNAIPNALLCIVDDFEDRLNAILKVGDINNDKIKFITKNLIGSNIDKE